MKILKKILNNLFFILVVTNVNLVDKNTYDIVFNNQIKIKNVVLEKVNDSYIIKFPTYISKKGKIYPQIKILTNELKEKIIDSILHNNIQQDNSELSWEIKKFYQYQKNKESNLKMFCSINFDNELEIDCKIMENKSGNTYVLWPSKKSFTGNTNIKQVLIKKNLKEKIEKELLKRYNALKKEGGFDNFEDN